MLLALKQLTVTPGDCLLLTSLRSQTFKISGKEKPASPRQIILTSGIAFLNRQNSHLSIPATPLPG